MVGRVITANDQVIVADVHAAVVGVDVRTDDRVGVVVRAYPQQLLVVEVLVVGGISLVKEPLGQSLSGRAHGVGLVHPVELFALGVDQRAGHVAVFVDHVGQRDVVVRVDVYPRRVEELTVHDQAPEVLVIRAIGHAAARPVLVNLGHEVRVAGDVHVGVELAGDQRTQLLDLLVAEVGAVLAQVAPGPHHLLPVECACHRRLGVGDHARVARFGGQVRDLLLFDLVRQCRTYLVGQRGILARDQAVLLTYLPDRGIQSGAEAFAAG